MEYIITLAILVVIYSILGISLNLVVGYAGLLSLAHAAFYGIGAYVTGILLTQFNVNFFISIIPGMMIAALASFLIGIVLSKFDGDYFALGSLGFGAIIFSVLLNWQEVTRGPMGIPGIAKPNLFGIAFATNVSFLLLALLFLILVYITAQFIINSSFGRALKAIREDEKVTQIFGYNTLHYKLAIFVVSAAMAATAGSLFASYITFIDPTGFNIMESTFILTIIILGGLASLRGSILGAVFLILLPEVMRFIGFAPDIAAQMRQVVYGIILILLMLYRPQGFMGEYKL
jgi:branched-chain amino acid transport system permease protein